jgi:hypothetical protein
MLGGIPINNFQEIKEISKNIDLLILKKRIVEVTYYQTTMLINDQILEAIKERKQMIEKLE